MLVAALLLKLIKLLVCSLVSVLLTPSLWSGKGDERVVLCLAYPETRDITTRPRTELDFSSK